MKIIKSLALFILVAAGLFGQSAGITYVTVGSGATPLLTANAGVTNFVWTLSTNVTSSTFSSPATGVGSLQLCEDGTGGRTVVFPANFVGFSGLASTALNYCQTYTWAYDGTNVNETGVLLSTGVVNPQTTTYQVLPADFAGKKTIGVASGTFTITLVASGSQPANGQVIDIFNYGSGVVTIARSGQNVNGGTTSYVLGPASATIAEHAQVRSDGSNYIVAGGFTNPLTTAGDLLCAGTSGLPTRIGVGTNKQIFIAGSSACGSYIDYPDAKVIPAGACAAGTAASALSTASSNFTAACRAGSNNLGGVLQAIPSTGASAQFEFELPKDWDTGSQPYINIFYGSGANTSGTVIWTVSSACTKEDGSVTDDPAFNAESAFSSQTMAAANREWAQNGQFTAITSGNNCIAGSNVVIKVAVSGTASSNINLSKIVLTTPRLLAVQAN